MTSMPPLQGSLLALHFPGAYAPGYFLASLRGSGGPEACSSDGRPEAADHRQQTRDYGEADTSEAPKGQQEIAQGARACCSNHLRQVFAA